MIGEKMVHLKKVEIQEESVFPGDTILKIFVNGECVNVVVRQGATNEEKLRKINAKLSQIAEILSEDF